jgi:hypothetical protein
MKYKAPFKNFCINVDALLVNILDANGEMYAQNIPIGDARMLIEFLNKKYADPIAEIVKGRRLEIKNRHGAMYRLAFDQSHPWDIEVSLHENGNTFKHDEIFAKYICEAINQKLEADGYVSSK